MSHEPLGLGTRTSSPRPRSDSLSLADAVNLLKDDELLRVTTEDLVELLIVVSCTVVFVVLIDLVLLEELTLK